MNEYSVRVLTGKPERLFQLLAESGMAVVGCDGCFLYILQGEAGGFYTMSHRPGGECYACKYYPDDRALRQAAKNAELLLHVDGVLRRAISRSRSRITTSILWRRTPSTWSNSSAFFAACRSARPSG